MMVQQGDVSFRYDVIVLTFDHKCCYYTNLLSNNSCTKLHSLCSQVQMWFTKANGKLNDITKLVL